MICPVILKFCWESTFVVPSVLSFILCLVYYHVIGQKNHIKVWLWKSRNGIKYISLFPPTQKSKRKINFLFLNNFDLDGIVASKSKMVLSTNFTLFLLLNQSFEIRNCIMKEPSVWSHTYSLWVSDFVFFLEEFLSLWRCKVESGCFRCLLLHCLSAFSACLALKTELIIAHYFNNFHVFSPILRVCFSWKTWRNFCDFPKK